MIGMDAQLAEKRAASYNVELEKEAQTWIEAVTGETFGASFQESLKDGVILCKYGPVEGEIRHKIVIFGFCCFSNRIGFFANQMSLYLRLINKISPGAVKKISTSKAPFVMMVCQIFFSLSSFDIFRWKMLTESLLCRKTLVTF